MHQSKWTSVALLAAVTVTLSCTAPQGGGAPTYKPPKKDRYQNVVIVTRNGACKVAGPKNHVAQPDENITWRVFNTCTAAKQALVVELTFPPAASGCPSPPFQQNPRSPQNPSYPSDPVNLDEVKDLTLKVKNQGFPPDTECAYTYSVKIQNDNNSEIDPELDIWP